MMIDNLLIALSCVLCVALVITVGVTVCVGAALFQADREGNAW